MMVPCISVVHETALDENREMTLCLAAACQYKDKSALVCVSDTRALSSAREWGLSISSENADKVREIGDFVALVAGDPTEADGLLAQCKDTIAKFSAQEQGPDSDLYYDAFFKGLRSGAAQKMKQVQDHYIAMNSPFKGIDDFLSRGKAALPDLQYRELWGDIQRLSLNSEVLVCGFHGEEVAIVKIDSKGSTQWLDQYGVIGSGSSEALSFLAQNSYDEQEIQLADCLLRLVEAQDFASTANNTVGSLKQTGVYLEDGSIYDVKDQFFYDVLKPKIRLSKAVSMGDCGDFLEKTYPEEVPSDEPKDPASNPGVLSPRQSAGQGPSSTEGGNGAPSEGVPEGSGTQS